MKLSEIFDSSNALHLKMMVDIDHFTASPRLNLKPETIKFLKSQNKKHNSMTLYRVLFTDNIKELASALGVDKLEKGTPVIHTAKRVTSWSKSINVVNEMATENDDLGAYAVILKANIPAKSILLDFDDLTDADCIHIHVFIQKEVTVDAGTFNAAVVDIIQT